MILRNSDSTIKKHHYCISHQEIQGSVRRITH